MITNHQYADIPGATLNVHSFSHLEQNPPVDVTAISVAPLNIPDIAVESSEYPSYPPPNV